MADEFMADPAGLGVFGERLAELDSRFRAVLGLLGGQVAGEGAGIACALVSGDAKDWHASYQNVQVTGKADSGVLDYWAGYVKRAGDAVQHSDQASQR